MVLDEWEKIKMSILPMIKEDTILFKQIENKKINTQEELKEFIQQLSEVHPQIKDFLDRPEIEVIKIDDDPEDITITPFVMNEIRKKFEEKRGGIIKLNKKLTFPQIKKWCQVIKEKLEKMVFPLTPSFEAEGKIISLLYPNKQGVALMMHYKGPELSFIGEPIKKRKNARITSVPFYIYQFLVEQKTYLLLSPERINSHYVKIRGLKISSSKELRIDTGKDILATIDMILLYDVEECEKAYTDEELSLFLSRYSLEDIKQTIFRQFRNTPIFEETLIAIMLSNNFGQQWLNFMMIGQAGGGKSMIANGIVDSLGENEDILSGTNSTIKALTPNFATRGSPKPGYFLECNRVCVVDEFLQMFTKVNKEDKGNILAELNDLLLGTKRSARTGHGEVIMNSTARFISFTNPYYHGKNIVNLLEAFNNEAFWSRILIYFQSEEHWNYVGNKKLTVSPIPRRAIIPRREFIRFYDAITDKHIDPEPVVGWIKRVYEKHKTFIPNPALTIYGRYNEHLLRILDGCVKLRMIKDKEMNMEPIEEDFEMAEEIFSMIVSSWEVPTDDYIMRLPPRNRARFLTANARLVWDELIWEHNGRWNLKKLRKKNSKTDILVFEMKKLEIADIEVDLEGEEWLVKSKWVKENEI